MKAKETSDIKRVLIAVPVYQNCEPDTFKSIYDLNIPRGFETTLAFFAGYTVTQARNRAVQASLDEKFDYTLFVDGDIVLLPNLLERLIALDADIATGWYIKKIPGLQDGITELYIMAFDGKNMKNVLQSEVPQNQAIPIAACGFGCTLVKNSLFPKVDDGMFFEYVERKDKSVASEDIYFCNKVRALVPDARIVVDTILRCPHIGKIAF